MAEVETGTAVSHHSVAKPRRCLLARVGSMGPLHSGAADQWDQCVCPQRGLVGGSLADVQPRGTAASWRSGARGREYGHGAITSPHSIFGLSSTAPSFGVGNRGAPST